MNQWFKSVLDLGLCSKGYFTHFPLLAAWLDMTYYDERAVKPESSILPVVHNYVDNFYFLNNTDITLLETEKQKRNILTEGLLTVH